MGGEYSALAFRKNTNGLELIYFELKAEILKEISDSNNSKMKSKKIEKILYSTKVDSACSSVTFRIEFSRDKVCQMYYKLENETEFTKIPFSTIPKNHSWVGAKLGVFSTAITTCKANGYVDITDVTVTML